MIGLELEGDQNLQGDPKEHVEMGSKSSTETHGIFVSVCTMCTIAVTWYPLGGGNAIGLQE